MCHVVVDDAGKMQVDNRYVMGVITVPHTFQFQFAVLSLILNSNGKSPDVIEIE